MRVNARIITTSWDDGHALDGRLADLLSRHEIQGTFYPSPGAVDSGDQLSDAGIRDIAESFEVGSHTQSHPDDMTRMTEEDALQDVRESRDLLEQISGKPVRMFCFPRGHYNRKLADAIAAEGFEASRTTDAFLIDRPLDGNLLHVTLQAYPHTRSTHMKHALRYANWRGLGTYLPEIGTGRDWVALGRRLLERVEWGGGAWHLWGHSWEIDRHDLWADLEELLVAASNVKNGEHLANGEVVKRLREQADSK